MSKIPTSLKIQTTSTQAHKPEEAGHGTIFSRRKDSGSKLFLALKNIFTRTDKSSANAAVTKAVPQGTTGSINSEVEKLGRPELDLRGRVRQVYRQLPNQSEAKVSHFDTAVHKIIDGTKLYGGELTKTL